MFKVVLATPWKSAFVQIDLKDAVITIVENGGESLEVVIGEGNLTYTEARNIEYKLNRGILNEVRLGDDIPLEVNFDFKWDYILGPSSSSTTTTGTPTVEDALKQNGAAADWTSTDSDPCRPYAVDLVITYIPNCSTGDTETITLSDFRYENLTHDTRNGTISCSGKCNITEATPVRAAQ